MLLTQTHFAPKIFNAPPILTVGRWCTALDAHIGPVKSKYAVADAYFSWAQTFAGHTFWTNLSPTDRLAVATATAPSAYGLDPHDIGDRANRDVTSAAELESLEL